MTDPYPLPREGLDSLTTVRLGLRDRAALGVLEEAWECSRSEAIRRAVRETPRRLTARARARDLIAAALAPPFPPEPSCLE